MTKLNKISWRSLAITALALASVIGVDFLAHGGLLASHYYQGSAFLLEPLDAFARIPAGYLSLLLLVGYLFVLMRWLRCSTWTAGLGVGALTGGAFGFSQALGMWSISTADPVLLIGWAIAYLIEFAIAGAIIGLGLAGMRLRHISLIVAAIVVSSIAATVLLQNLGLAPAQRAYAT